MPGGPEVSEEIEHAVHENKGMALLIAVLALFLAFASAGGKGAQTEAISENVESADLWAFYQAKAIRATTLLTAAEMLETEIAAESNPRRRWTGALAYHCVLDYLIQSMTLRTELLGLVIS